VLESIFLSILNKKFIVHFMNGGNKSHAEILMFNLFFLLRQLYVVSLPTVLYTVLKRLNSVFTVQQVRIGARKYAVPQPVSLRTQIEISVKRLFIANVRSSFRLYYFFIVLLDLYYFNRSNSKLALESLWLKQQNATTNRHLQHYR
jgi:hypothetical protein